MALAKNANVASTVSPDYGETFSFSICFEINVKKYCVRRCCAESRKSAQEIVEKILLRIQFMFRGIALFLWFSKAIPAYAIYMISIDVELTCVNRADDM
ncbi:hypothetical protein RB195_018340 [Necator americanus]|uniref:Uncharacterized protein n=1 Tax=Necator americanus TaxID=51031 RepID=A0ABR1CBL8_NECAM